MALVFTSKLLQVVNLQFSGQQVVPAGRRWVLTDIELTALGPQTIDLTVNDQRAQVIAISAVGAGFSGRWQGRLCVPGGQFFQLGSRDAQFFAVVTGYDFASL